MKVWSQYIYEENKLTEALSEYNNYLERGYYAALDQYSLENRDWSDEDEIDLIENILRDNTPELEYFGIQISDDLTQELQKGSPYGLHNIVNFISALDLLKTQERPQSNKELEQLNTSKINVQIEAGMPVASLAKLEAIICSSIDKDSKLSLISYLINTLSSNRDNFGFTSDLVLKFALDEWLSLANTDKSYSADYQKFTELAKQHHSIEYIEKHQTYFDLLIFDISEKLNNKISNPPFGNLKDKVYRNNKSVFFSSLNTNNTSEDKNKIKGELLESFTEIILGELEALADINDEEIKNLLLDALFDHNQSVENVVKYTSEVEPTFKNRFAIIYCCLHKDKWEEEWMKGFKEVVIDSYVRVAQTESQGKTSEWLKTYAQSVLTLFFKERGIGAIALSQSELSKKERIINNMPNFSVDYSELEEDIDMLEKDKEMVLGLIKEDRSFSISDNILENKSIFSNYANDKVQQNTTSIKSGDLGRTDQRWARIYDIVKFKPKSSSERDENKMRDIVRAILHKEYSGCCWKDLPQSMPKATTVRHYYYQFKHDGKLEEIKKNFSSDTMESNYNTHH